MDDMIMACRDCLWEGTYGEMIAEEAGAEANLCPNCGSDNVQADYATVPLSEDPHYTDIDDPA